MRSIQRAWFDFRGFIKLPYGAIHAAELKTQKNHKGSTKSTKRVLLIFLAFRASLWQKFGLPSKA